MATVRYGPNESRELTAAERQQLEHAKTLPVVYDEDSPELDEIMEDAFIAARRAKPYNGRPLTVYVSPDTAKEAERLGEDYQGYFVPPKRRREEITRSRGDRVRDKHFSKANNDELIKFCKGTGLRRGELSALRGGDLVSRQQIDEELAQLETVPMEKRTPQQARRMAVLKDTELFQEEYFILVRSGKGGRERLSPIVGKNAGQIIERMKDTPQGEKVWQHVHQSADIHAYRAVYATNIYKAHARKIEDIPYDRVSKKTNRRYQSQVYACRKDEAGKKLDKAAMLVCSKALGHNRIDVVANNYIRGL